MFVSVRTPTAKTARSQSTDGSPSGPGRVDPAPTNVRRSVGEWEAGRSDPLPTSQPKTGKDGASGKPSPRRVILPRPVRTVVSPSESKIVGKKPTTPRDSSPHNSTVESCDRVKDAKLWLQRAKSCLSDSRNIRTDLKNGIGQAVTKLYGLVCDAEKARKQQTETAPQPAPHQAPEPASTTNTAAIDALAAKCHELALGHSVVD